MRTMKHQIRERPYTPVVTTKQASEDTGLSEWELRRGFKEGVYPAIIIGRGKQARRLRWDLEILHEAIRHRMEEGE